MKQESSARARPVPIAETTAVLRQHDAPAVRRSSDVDLRRQFGAQNRRIAALEDAVRRLHADLQHHQAQQQAAPAQVWISIKDAQREIGCSRRTIYNLLAKGRLVMRRTASGMPRIAKDSLWR